jgi:DNA-binding CsgD family transcriptional regulator
VRPPEELPLRVACGIGIADSVVALTTAVVSRPQAASVVVGLLWVVLWSLALAYSSAVAVAVRARPWLLLVAGVGGTALALLDGGYPGNIATQPTWVVVVAAALALGAPFTLALGAAIAAAKAGTFLLAGLAPADLLPPSMISTETFAPLPIAALALVFVAGLVSVQAAVRTALAPPPAPALSPAEHAVVALLATGLTPKQIAAERGTSVETVRTQIKRAKRTAGARTLDELVATAWRPTA